MSKITAEEVKKIVNERGEQYGDTIKNFTRAAAMWTAILGRSPAISPYEVALCMMAVKLSRMVNKPTQDSMADFMGYDVLSTLLSDYKSVK